MSCARPGASPFGSSKTVTRVTPPAASSPLSDDVDRLAGLDVELLVRDEPAAGVRADVQRLRALAATCSRTRIAPPFSVTASSAVSATPSAFAAGSGKPSFVGSVMPVGDVELEEVLRAGLRREREDAVAAVDAGVLGVGQRRDLGDRVSCRR